jgi:hypothetical protein
MILIKIDMYYQWNGVMLHNISNLNNISMEI